MKKNARGMFDVFIVEDDEDWLREFYRRAQAIQGLKIGLAASAEDAHQAPGSYSGLLVDGNLGSDQPSGLELAKELVAAGKMAKHGFIGWVSSSALLPTEKEEFEELVRDLEGRFIELNKGLDRVEWVLLFCREMERSLVLRK